MSYDDIKLEDGGELIDDDEEDELEDDEEDEDSDP